MLRAVSILMTGALLLAVSVSCDDATTNGTGGATSTGTGTGTGVVGGNGGGGTGGTGAAGGSGGTGGTGGSTPANACEAGVEHGVVCPQAGFRCTKPAGCCECLEIIGCGAEPIWICVEPPGDAECPPSAPSYNEACTTEGASCEYCPGDQVSLWRCFGGVWLERMPGCTGPG